MSAAAADEPTANFQRTKMLAALIRSTRNELGLSQEDVVEQTGISMSALYLIEAGERRGPDGQMSPYRTGAQTLVKLAHVLGITAAQLEAVNRSDAAVLLLTEHLQSGELSDTAKRQLILSLRKLSDGLPNFATLVEWVGIATGQLNPSTRRRDDDA